MNNSTKTLKVVIGLGKTGRSCVRYLKARGFNIAGVDSRAAPEALAELQQDFPDLPLHLGDFNAPFLADAEELLVSPGVSLQEPAIAKAIANGVKVAGDIELFCRAAKAPIIAITGSNGKSTVTTLVGEMAKAAGRKVSVGGNLGTPALDFLALATPELYVLELSSFQLETTTSLAAKAAVILNISEDHMDRYATLDAYTKAKQRIYTNAEWSVINRDDPSSFNGIDFANKNKVVSFGLNPPQKEQDFGINNNQLVLGSKTLLLLTELKIKGHHQAANALAALALGKAFGLPMDAMLNALREFKGLKHRCELVATIDGVGFYNDSKGTNVGATQAAVFGIGAGIPGKVILIAGGLGKGADFTALREVVTKYTRALVLIGRDAPIIEQALQHTVPMFHATSLEQAITIARGKAEPKDAILLSPACASFDMFKNFEHRGEEFERLVGALVSKG